MAERKRNEKGQFIKGNTEGIPFPKGDAQRERARQGGLASGEAKKEKRLLKEVLRDILLEKVDMTDATGQRVSMTKQEIIVQNVLNRMQKKGTPKDLKIIAEILGEMEINVNLTQSEKPRIVFEDGEDE